MSEVDQEYSVTRRIFTPQNIIKIFGEYWNVWLDHESFYILLGCTDHEDIHIPKDYVDGEEFELEYQTIPDTLDLLAMSGLIEKMVPAYPARSPVYRWIDA